jgi:RHS repeat-associated protein
VHRARLVAALIPPESSIATAGWVEFGHRVRDLVLYVEGQEIKYQTDTAGAYVGSSINTTRYYTSGGATIGLRNNLNQIHWMLGNHQGSASHTIQSNTTTPTTQRYQPFGAPRGATNQLPTDRDFLGQTQDDTTNLNYLNNRYYDPTLLHFTSVDPAVVETSEAYGYTNGNPITQSDPSGLRPCDNPRQCDGPSPRVPQRSSCETERLSPCKSRYFVRSDTGYGSVGFLPDTYMGFPLGSSDPGQLMSHVKHAAKAADVDELVLWAVIERENATYNTFKLGWNIFSHDVVDDVGHLLRQGERRGVGGMHEGAYAKVRNNSSITRRHPELLDVPFDELGDHDDVAILAVAFRIRMYENEVLAAARDNGVPVVSSSELAPTGYEELSLTAMATASHGQCNCGGTFADLYLDAFDQGDTFDTVGGDNGRSGYGYGMTALNQARAAYGGS